MYGNLTEERRRLDSAINGGAPLSAPETVAAARRLEDALWQLELREISRKL